MQFQLLRAPKNSSYKHDIDIYISYDLDRHLILSNHKKRKWSGLETNIYHLFARVLHVSTIRDLEYSKGI